MSGSETVRKFYEQYFANKAWIENRAFLVRSHRQRKEADGEGELTPAATAIRSEIQERFERAVEELDPNDKEIIVMRHFEQMSNREVAQVLKLSEAAASMRYLRAIRRLKEKFSPGSQQ